MRSDLADITVILDRSGSMMEVRTDTIGGFNAFLEAQQKAPGECLITLVQFDSENPFEVLYRGILVSRAPRLTSDSYVPRGSTPLLDAIGRGIVDTGHRLSQLAELERPGKVIFVILTDGAENASQEYKTKAAIKTMVDHQHDVYKWEFVFIGANFDAFAEGASMGMAAGSTLQMTQNAKGVRAAYASTASNVAAYRSGLVETTAFNDADRQAQEDAATTTTSQHSDSTTTAERSHA